MLLFLLFILHIRAVTSTKGRRFECKRHLNQLKPRHIKNVTQKDIEELSMEVIYDAFKIQVPISPSEPMEVSPTPQVSEVQAP